MGFTDPRNDSTDCNLRTTSRVKVKVGNPNHCTPHFYTLEKLPGGETFYKVPTWQCQRSYPLRTNRSSKSSDCARPWCPWPSTLKVRPFTKVTLIALDHCHLLALYYGTTNYSLPIILTYTTQAIYSLSLFAFYTTQTSYCISLYFLYFY